MDATRIFLYILGAAALLWLLRRAWRGKMGGIAVEHLAELKKRGAQILDVRTPVEFEQGHAPESRNLPLDQLLSHIDELDHRRPILVCCASGARSGMAKTMLERAGFPEVHNAGPWNRLL